MNKEKTRKFQGDRFKIGYLDESGDTGKRGSKCLVLTYICTDDGKKISRVLKKAKEQIRRSKRGERWLNRLGGEIKFHGFPEEHIRLKLLEEIAKIGFEIRFVAIYKSNEDIHESEKEMILFNLLAESFVNNQSMPYKIIADKDYFKNKKIAFLAVKNYEERMYEDGKTRSASYDVHLLEDREDASKCNLIIPIKHENSKHNPELQATDLISGAIFQEMENDDKTYTDILRKYIKLKGAIKKPKEK